MAGWTASNISSAGMLCIVNGNAATSDTSTPGPFYGASSTQSFSGDTVNVALFNNGVTTATASTDTLAHNAYLGAGGQWTSGNELATTGGYTIAGVAVTPKAETQQAGGPFNVAKFTSSGTPNWTSATFSAYGCLVYDNTVTNKYVYCWNYFGGIQTVTSGTFTINWNASGIFTITCT
jgi:hypothetical protein